MLSAAEVYNSLLSHLLSNSKANFDPFYRRVRLGDFGVIKEGEFESLVNLFQPDRDARERLEACGIEELPHWEEQPQLQSKVEDPLLERSTQGIIAVGARVRAGCTAALSGGAPTPVKATVTIDVDQEVSAMLSLDQHDRKVVQISAAMRATGIEYLQRNLEAILGAFFRKDCPDCRFVTDVQLCYGYSITFMRNPKEKVAFVLNNGLFVDLPTDEEQRTDVYHEGGCRRTARQLTTAGAQAVMGLGCSLFTAVNRSRMEVRLRISRGPMVAGRMAILYSWLGAKVLIAT